jgi:hypothetical protein
VIFSRGGGGGGRHQADDPRRSSRQRRTGDDRRSGGSPLGDGEVEPTALPDAVSEELIELSGPYDISEAPADVLRVDLGSLQIPAMDGVEIRAQDVDGVIRQVVLIHEGSALQLGAFAAPRTEGIWDEVRAEIRKSLFDDGVAVEEVTGTYGQELRARVRSPEGMMDIRFIGIDGPRWMLRAVYQGPAAVDPTVSVALARCLRGVVVNRGPEAMPVSEALPLQLPREVVEAARAQAARMQDATADDGEQGQTNGVPPMDPNARTAGPVAANGQPGGNGLPGGSRVYHAGAGSEEPGGRDPFTGGSTFGGGSAGDGYTTDGRTGPAADENGTPGSVAGDSAPRRRPSPRPRRSE